MLVYLSVKVSSVLSQVRIKEERRKSPGSGGSGAGSGSEDMREKLSLRDLPKAESKKDLSAAVAVAKQLTQSTRRCMYTIVDPSRLG